MVNLKRPEVFETRCRMERDLRNIMAVKIPGWKPPKVRIVYSRHNMKEVVNSDTLGRHFRFAIESMIRSYNEPPPWQYWIDFGVSVPESIS